MAILNERFVVKGQIVERDRTKLPEGVLCRVDYPICNIDVKNHNNRIYEKAVWDKVFGDPVIKEKIETRTLFGHAEHPETSQSNVEKVSHVVNKMWLDEAENKAKAQFDVLDTPYGRIVNTLLLAECQIGCSTRADGELEEATDKDGTKYFRVIPESYKFVTVDFTADPSTIGAYPEKVERDLVGVISQGVETKKIDLDYASTLLEHMKVAEAKALLESIKAEPDAKVEEKKEEVVVEIRRVDEKIVSLGKKLVESYPQSPQIMGFLADNWNEFKDAKEASEKVAAKFEISSAEASRHVAAASDVFGQLESMVGSTVESVTPIEVRKKFKILEITEAETRAERDTLLALAEGLKGDVVAVREAYASDVVALTERYNALVSELSALQNTLLVSDKKWAEEKFGLTAQVTQLTESAEKDRQTLSAKVEEIKTLSEGIAQKTKENESIAKQLADVKEAHQKELASLKEQHQKALLKKYYETKISTSGLKLPTNALTLLEQCESEAAIDQLIEKFRDAISEEHIHSEKISSVKIESPTLNMEEKKVFDAVALIMGGIKR